MSGPITARFFLDRRIILALLAAEPEATEVHARVAQLEQRLVRLAAVLDEAEPADFARRRAALGDDPVAWHAYAETLEGELQSRSQRLLAEADAAAATAAATLSPSAAPPQDFGRLLQDFLATRQSRKKLREQQALREKILNILAPLERAGAALPPRLAALIEETLRAETPARADLLIHELQREVQALCLTQKQQNAARSAAEESVRERAAALALEQSLRDLGYRVEPIPETLFAEGGMTHFQKPGWDDYYVRLRANPREHSFNFNVVRADDGAATASTSRQDFLAEERWCAELPQLLATLAARGLKLEVTRHVEAGQLPVQTVPPERLPARASEESRQRRDAPPKTRPLPPP